MIQLRDSEGGIREVDTFKEAFEAAKEDRSIWKISWPEDDNRIRLVRGEDGWVYEPIVVIPGW